MNVEQDVSKDIVGLPFDEEARAARALAKRLYWHFIRRLAFSFILASAVLAVALNTLYRISVARVLYWPSSLVTPQFGFQEPDPVLQAYVDGDQCHAQYEDEDSPQRACDVTNWLATGEHGKVLQWSKENFRKGSDDSWRLLGLLLSHIRDAVARRDWATCAQYGNTALHLLNWLDKPPWMSSADDNQLLLLASVCQSPDDIYRQSELYVSLLDRMVVGAHLSEESLGSLADAKPRTQLQAWGKYLSALVALRANRFSEAAAGFRAAERESVSMVRELALLGLSRAEFWQYASLSASGKVTPGLKATTLAALREHAARSKWTSFQTDIQYYMGEVSR